MTGGNHGHATNGLQRRETAEPRAKTETWQADSDWRWARATVAFFSQTRQDLHRLRVLHYLTSWSFKCGLLCQKAEMSNCTWKSFPPVEILHKKTSWEPKKLYNYCHKAANQTWQGIPLTSLDSTAGCPHCCVWVKAVSVPKSFSPPLEGVAI